MSLLGFCQWLEQTSLSVAIRESSWGFPIIESVHVLGLCLFGIAVVVDLRVLNLALRGVPLPEVGPALAPWILAGVAVMIISGVLTFLNTPVEYYNDTFFRLKMFLLLLVGVNSLILRGGRWRRAAPGRALSLVLWAGIIVAGRMITYRLAGTP